MANKLLDTGDVVMVEGHAQVSQLGRCAIIPTVASGMAYQNHLFRIRGKRDRLTSEYLTSIVNGPIGRRYFEQFGGTTSGLTTVNTSNVRRMTLPLPVLEEQRVIVRVLASLDSRMGAEERQLNALRGTKGVVADALLSGRVRVTPKLEVRA
jgi:type I restriction enzyme S subunit